MVGVDSFVDNITANLSKTLKVSANEELHHFLSLKITRDIPAQLAYLSQAHYINNLERIFDMKNCLRVKTPTDIHFKDLQKRIPEESPSPGPSSQ